MIHGWNGVISSLETPIEERRKEVLEPGVHYVEPGRPFLYRRTEIDGCRVVEIGDQFLSAIRLFVIAIIFLLSFSIMWRAIDRLGANDNLNEGAISDPTQ